MPRADKTKVLLESQGSDDAGIMAVVAKQMQTSWEKKRKDKETKYFTDAQTVLHQCVTEHKEGFLEAVADLNSAYEKFVQDYAGVEDEIRKLLIQLSLEQQKLVTLAGKKHEQMAESEKIREREQVRGMAVAKKATEDFHRLTTTLHDHE
ncbi:hypothetical protein DAEQUDRAFT_759697 [Daedalea quercina L-15889]|uniref:Uncharacterized protein n=1 Tax=Daedalea quercina L-15889 TaxID=1314783 RepID=A0A165LU61_9APHY|nr:hypothetical protein DAEQUDRAFT_759697 [Daedalea quercina L-15889]